MARSSLLGIDPAPSEAAGRDKDLLGPSDSSDSGSDLAGLDEDDDPADPGLPADVALRDGGRAPLPLGESLAVTEGGSGVRDGADIGVDQVFTPGGGPEDDPAAAIDAIGEAPLDEADDGEEEEDDVESEVDENDNASRAKPGPGQGWAVKPADAVSADEEVPGGPDPAGHRPGRG